MPYEPPQFTDNDRNHFFSLNEVENDILLQFRDANPQVTKDSSEFIRHISQYFR